MLIVDDHKFLRGILGDMLRGFGVTQLYMAENGVEGIKQFKTWLPSLVFTDLNMAPMNGLEFANWIRTDSESPNSEVPIVMLTANNDQQSITDARDVGVSELIVKPVVPKSVLRRLNAVMFEPRRFIRSARYTGPCRRRRENANYKGVYRRITDPIEVNTVNEDTKEMIGEIFTEAEALMDIARTLDVTNRKDVLDIYNRTKETKEMAVKADDENLGGAAQSLVGYIEAMGASGDMDVRVVKMHLEAIMSLVHLEDNGDGQRDAVVTSLQKLVQKKFRDIKAA
ncbi:Chemotaxis response regulator protein-glutamate methylesterase CheB [hydrothermal vent metagenome]|uniref:Chemotaxis response regulator protein-glutamate methylesterase CheB n=1 Tax=hydrothermal vent metagenome TaxID=652676 RepID=A0A3B0RSU0_9ZZZZ